MKIKGEVQKILKMPNLQLSPKTISTTTLSPDQSVERNKKHLNQQQSKQIVPFRDLSHNILLSQDTTLTNQQVQNYHIENENVQNQNSIPINNEKVENQYFSIRSKSQVCTTQQQSQNDINNNQGNLKSIVRNNSQGKLRLSDIIRNERKQLMETSSFKQLLLDQQVSQLISHRKSLSITHDLSNNQSHRNINQHEHDKENLNTSLDLVQATYDKMDNLIYSPTDETMKSNLFTQNMAKQLKDLNGTEIYKNTGLHKLADTKIYNQGSLTNNTSQQDDALSKYLQNNQTLINQNTSFDKSTNDYHQNYHIQQISYDKNMSYEKYNNQLQLNNLKCIKDFQATQKFQNNQDNFNNSNKFDILKRQSQISQITQNTSQTEIKIYPINEEISELLTQENSYDQKLQNNNVQSNYQSKSHSQYSNSKLLPHMEISNYNPVDQGSSFYEYTQDYGSKKNEVEYQSQSLLIMTPTSQSPIDNQNIFLQVKQSNLKRLLKA